MRPPLTFHATRLRLRGWPRAVARVFGTYAALALLLAFWPLIFIERVTHPLLQRWGWWRSTISELERRPPATISVESDALVIDERRIPLSDIEGGWVEPLGINSRVVVLKLRGAREVFAEMATDEHASQLLSAVGVAPEQQALRLPLASTLVATGRRFASHVLMVYFGFSILAGAVVAPIEQASRGAVAGAVVTACITAAILFFAGRFVNRRVRRGSVVVGADGFEVRRPGVRPSFVSYDDVVQVRMNMHRAAVEVATRSGPVELPLGNVVDDEDELARALLARLTEALERYRARTRADVDISLLDRKGRSLDAWRQDLATLRDGGYRTARIGEEMLVELLGDDGAPRERRVAAALSLLDGADAAKRRHVEAARDRAAHPKLRIALDGALDGSLEEATLEALAAEESALAEQSERR